MQSIFARGVYLGENSSQSAARIIGSPMATQLCARQTASLLSKKGEALFGQSLPARPCGKQSRAGDVFYSASCSGSSSVMVGMKARASLPRPRCLI